MFDQGGKVYRLAVFFGMRAFEPGKGEQIGDQAEHAVAFVLHQAEEFLLLFARHVGHIDEGFEKAVDYG